MPCPEDVFSLANVCAAIDAATRGAIATARRTGTNLVVWEDGKIIEITPDEADAMMNEGKSEENH